MPFKCSIACAVFSLVSLCVFQRRARKTIMSAACTREFVFEFTKWIVSTTRSIFFARYPHVPCS